MEERGFRPSIRDHVLPGDETGKAPKIPEYIHTKWISCFEPLLLAVLIPQFVEAALYT